MPAMADADVRSTQTIYTGRIFTVTVDRVKLPHGPEVNLEVVRHPGSVVMICVPAPGHLVLVRQYRYCAGGDLWEIPAGSLSGDEDPEAGARRECHEEIGLVPRTIRHLTTLYPTPGFCTERMLFYQCTDLAEPDAEAHQDEDEHIEVRTVTVDEAWAMVDRGEIADLKTVTALTLMTRRPGNAERRRTAADPISGPARRPGRDAAPGPG
jgi:ADP-ribose pyrophosphatase